MARLAPLDQAAAQLRAVLPHGWTLSVSSRSRGGGAFRIASPSGITAELDVRSLKDTAPRSVATLAPTDRPTLVVGDWLSERTRTLLRSRRIDFLDATGNIEVQLTDPGLFIRTTGAHRNPSPKPTDSPRLRGPKAWALLRTLAEVPPPFGVRDLAQTVDVDAGYVSRVLRALEDELLITRTPRGPVTAVEWEGVLRRAASTYSLFDSNETSTWVTTSGPERLLDDLTGMRAGRWAVTGSFAASRIAPVAAPEVAVIYTAEPDRLVKARRLLPAKTRGTNVILAEPYDPIAFERTTQSGGITYASMAQVTLDCLTGNGRMPAEGEALLTWMRKNEPRWRTGALEPRGKKRRT